MPLFRLRDTTTSRASRASRMRSGTLAIEQIRDGRINPRNHDDDIQSSGSRRRPARSRDRRAGTSRKATRVKVDQPMVSVETAKAVVEVPSPYTGTIGAARASRATSSRPARRWSTSSTRQRRDGRRPREARRREEADPRRPMIPVPSSATWHERRRAGRDARSRAATARRGRARARGARRARAREAARRGSRPACSGTGRGGLITVDDVMTRAGPTPMHQRSNGHWAEDARAPRPRRSAGTRARDRRTGTARPAPRMAQSMSLSRDERRDLHAVRRCGHARLVARATISPSRLLRAIAAGCAAEPALNAWFDGENADRAS